MATPERTDAVDDPASTAPAPAQRPSGVRGVLSRLPLSGRDVPEPLAGLAAAIRESSPKVDLREVVRAYEYAATAHDGQLRKSGEPYISHPVAVATELAHLGLDTDTLVAALLHDVVEDTPASRDQLEEWFGEAVAHLVDGVTKLDRIQVESRREQQAETLRKMILAMARDIRVLLIKLADRLHNMSTIQYMPREKQKRIAQETLDIYAPLAHRLGMQRFKVRLEDLGFQTLHPKRFEEIAAMVAERQPERETYVDEVVDEVRETLKVLRIKASVVGRPKHYYSIYEKMVLRGREFDEIQDLIGVRVITNTVRDCYALLGEIHAVWRPLPGRFKDYIAMPKFNLYRSLHTTVIGPGGRPLEIQIRTEEMHHTAEYGVAAHWKYKEDRRGRRDAAPDDLPWLDQLVEWQDEVAEPDAYLESLKLDLYSDEVFVFTPDGDVRSLPAGSTPIDFAYAIHTEVGHRCVGARVNGRLVPLEHRLSNGDTVEVLTSKAEDAGPSRDWLKIAVSNRALSKIRGHFNRERREDAEERGREMFAKAVRRRGLSQARFVASGELEEAAAALNYHELSTLYRAIGEGHLPTDVIIEQLVAEVDDEPPEPVPVRGPIRIGRTAAEGIEVDGDSSMVVNLARCCTPVPGDEILGFVTRGRGVSVHRTDCPNADDLRQEPERIVPVAWSAQGGTRFLVTVQIEALDRKHLLRDVTEVLGDLHINILAADVSTRTDRVGVLRFSFELADPAHLDYALRQVKQVPGVYDAFRVTPQGAPAG